MTIAMMSLNIKQRELEINPIICNFGYAKIFKFHILTAMRSGNRVENARVF